MRYLLLSILLSLALSANAEAQSVRLTPSPSPLFALARPSAPQDTTRPPPPPTHWKEGAIAGGLTLGLFGAVASVGLCQSLDEGAGTCGASLYTGFIGGGILGGIIGALIGGQFPK